MGDPYKNCNGVRRDKWLVERGLVYSIGTWSSLLSERQCYLHVSPWSLCIIQGKYLRFPQTCVQPSIITHNFSFSLCCFCHVMLVCWFKMSFPFKMSVLFCINMLPRWCEVVLMSSMVALLGEHGLCRTPLLNTWLFYYSSQLTVHCYV